MSFEVKGLKEIQQKLDDLKNRANALDGTHQVSFSVLFDQGFMAQHSKYTSFNDLLLAGGYEVNSEADFKAIPDDDFDKHVSASTNFDSWEDMKKAAAAEYIKKQLGF